MKPELFRLHAEIEDRHWWFVARRQILHRLVERFLPAGGVIVDVGCGTGGNIAELARDGRYRCVGIDPTAAAIDLARERFPQVDFVHGFAPDELGDTAEKADLFLLNDVLEHVEDDVGLLGSLVAASRPGALFLITVPADPALWSQHDESFGHFRRYTREGFARLWAELSAEPLLLSHFNARLYPVVRARRAVSRWWGGAGGSEGSDLSLLPGPANALLTRIFAGETDTILHSDPRAGEHGYDRGVSLLVVLQHVPRRMAAARTRATPVAAEVPR